MKNKLLSFLNTYKFCFLMGVLLVLAIIILSACFKDVVLNDDSIFRMTVVDYYLLLGWPFLSALFGALSFIFLKKVFMPSLVISITVWIMLAIVSLIMDPKNIYNLKGIFSIGALILPIITFVFSFASALITKFFAWLIRESKKAWTE